MKNKLNEQLNYPDFSIIIPTRNRAELLKKTLRRIERIEYKGVWEVIIVNNNSIDNTEKVIKEFLQKNRNFRMIIEKLEGISFARNAGIEKSKYNHIVFIDDDVFVNKDILTKFSLSLYKFPTATGIGGRINGRFQTRDLYAKYLKWFQNIAWVFTIWEKESEIKLLQYPDFLCTACICFRKNKINFEMFDTRMGKVHKNFFIGGEDLETTLRLLGKGHILIYDSSIQVSHHIDESRFYISYLIKRFIQTGIENRLVEKILQEKGFYFDSWRWHKDQLKICVKSILLGRNIPSRLVRIIQILLFRIGYDWYKWLVRIDM